MLIKNTNPLADLNELSIALQLDDIKKFSKQYLEMQNLYQAAIREVSTKLEILDNDFQARHSRNPIHHIQCRLKSPSSMFKKLSRKGFPATIDSAKKNLTDIAGVRVVCSYIEDIYTISRMIKRQDDVTVIRETDYIKHPKENGYRSLHLVVKIPVFFSDRKIYVPVEIQIRTIAMDFWASLEHELRYKAGMEVPPTITAELQACAETIAQTDLDMQRIYNSLEQLEMRKEA